MNATPKDEQTRGESLPLLRDARRSWAYAAYREAALDPAFIAEMREIANAFDAALPDGLSAEE